MREFSTQSDRSFWVRSMTCKSGFEAEQAKLGRVWTFLGFQSDIPSANDWFRTTLGGRPIFVQRFEGGRVAAFVNRCAHRFYPLRTQARGNGAVVCGFHHWRYNAEGLALGIPKCQEMYGCSPRELNARLEVVEIATCGELIFGRFGPGDGASLTEWLGEGFHIIKHLVSAPSRFDRTERSVAANWKLLTQISLDDYHLVAVHPTSFGKAGYLALESVKYFRFGAHSTFLRTRRQATLSAIAAACRDGTYHPEFYQILQFFPNLIIVVTKAIDLLGDQYWYVLVQRLVPKSHGRTRSITRFAPLPFSRPADTMRTIARATIAPYVRLGVALQTRRIHGEDNAVVENLQKQVAIADGTPRYAAHEQRIVWFEEAYSQVLSSASVRDDTGKVDAS